MNTTLGASSAGLVSLLLGSWISGTYDLRLCCNGVLSGLVTVTALCGFVEPYAAAVCGAIAGAAYIGFSHLMVGRAGWGGLGWGCKRSWVWRE
jgi:Amt family ammonium transporter